MTNRLYTGDNLHFLHRFNSESVDLVYLDPPFNSKRCYSASTGSEASGVHFKDMWTWQDIDEGLLETLLTTHPCLAGFIKSIEGMHDKPMMAYVLYMAVRIKELHRVLKPSGSLYLHCDPTASHYLKLVLDEVFGRDNFRNEIVWRIGWVSGYKTQKRGWIRNHDIVLYYVKDARAMPKFNKEYIPYPPDYVRRDGKKPTGKGVPLEDTWNCSAVDVLDSIMIKSFSKEKTGYPTQKPLALLERIIRASSVEGDVVLDPFCGCATTCVAAQQLGRKWIAIDIEKQAAGLLQTRLKDAGLSSDFIHSHELPTRTDIKIETDSESMREKLYNAQKGICNICTAEFESRHFELDYIIPKSKGGSDTESNYQLLCSDCSRIKGDRPMEYLRMRIAQIDQALATQITFGR